jgi:hypothetical protein
MAKLRRQVLKHQHAMIYSKAKYPAIVSGMGAGKSESLVMKVLKQLFDIREFASIAVYEPTVDLVKRIMYPRFEEIFSNAGLKYKLNKSEGIIVIDSVGEIIFRSLDNPSRLIGYEVHHSHVDELDTLEEDKAENAWNKIIARNRKRIEDNTQNTVSVYTTPEGFRFVYKQWEKKRKRDIELTGRSDYEIIRGRTYDNPFLPDDFIPSLEASFPKQLIQAYLNGEFVNMNSGQVYVDYDMEKNHTNITIKDYEKPFHNIERLHIGMDFNINHMSAVAGFYRDGKMYIVDEICDVRDTPSIIAEINRRYSHFPITIYPDASGNSRKTVDASKSDIALLREAGFAINAPKKNGAIRDRIVSVNTMFCNSKDERRLFINMHTCPNLCSNLNEQAYDDYGNPQKTNNVDHNIDALGYLIHRKMGVSAPKSIISRFSIV